MPAAGRRAGAAGAGAGAVGAGAGVVGGGAAATVVGAGAGAGAGVVRAMLSGGAARCAGQSAFPAHPCAGVRMGAGLWSRRRSAIRASNGSTGGVQVQHQPVPVGGNRQQREYLWQRCLFRSSTRRTTPGVFWPTRMPAMLGSSSAPWPPARAGRVEVDALDVHCQARGGGGDQLLGRELGVGLDGHARILRAQARRARPGCWRRAPVGAAPSSSTSVPPCSRVLRAAQGAVCAALGGGAAWLVRSFLVKGRSPRGVRVQRHGAGGRHCSIA